MKDSESKKKIAIINSVCGVGSTGRICVELADFLEKNDFKTLICFGRGHKKTDNQYKFTSNIGVFFHALYARIFDKSGFGSIIATKRLIKKLELFKPDLLIVNNLHGYYLNINIFLKWLSIKNVKTIAILHDCWNFTGHCAYFDYVNCSKWIDGCHNCPNKKMYPASVCFDNSKTNYKIKKERFTSLKDFYIVTPSKWLSNLVKRSFLKYKGLFVINNGIDTSAFKKTTSGFREKYNLVSKKIILCVANIFEKRKGLFDILELSKIIDKNQSIVVVGHIPGKIILPKNVIHIDRTSDINELIDIYSSSDVLFNPTYEDNYPTTNLEALSCKTPVICYRTGGAIEMIDEKFVVDQGDYKQAYALMKELFDGKIKYPFGSSNDFSKENMHKEYLKLINDILDQNKV